MAANSPRSHGNHNDSCFAGRYIRARPRLCTIVVLSVGAATIIPLGVGGGPAIALRAMRNHSQHALSVDQTFLKLGDLWARDNIKHTITITNNTSLAVRIVKFQTSCKCTSVNPAQTLVPAQSSVDVQLTLDLGGTVSKPSQGDATDLAVDIGAIIDGTEAPTIWRLSGHVRQPFRVRPHEIRFPPDDMNAQRRPFSPQVIELVTAAEVEGVVVSCNPTFASVLIKQLSPRTQNGRWQLTITPRSDLRLGTFRFSVPLEVRTATDSFPVRPICVTGTVVDDIQFTPSCVRLNPATIGDTVSQRVVATSRSSQRFLLDELSRTDLGTEVRLITDHVLSDAHIIEVRQRIVLGGAHSNNVDLTATAEMGDIRFVPFSIVYYGR